MLADQKEQLLVLISFCTFQSWLLGDLESPGAVVDFSAWSLIFFWPLFARQVVGG